MKREIYIVAAYAFQDSGTDLLIASYANLYKAQEVCDILRKTLRENLFGAIEELNEDVTKEDINNTDFSVQQGFYTMPLILNYADMDGK